MARTESARSKSRRMPEAAPPVPVSPGAAKPTLGSPQWTSARRLALKILLIELIVTIFALFVFHSSAVVAHGNETTFDRAVFTTVNASTLTGFQQTMGVREMRESGVGGPIMLLTLTLAGSMISLTLGGLAACRVLRMPHKPGQIIWAAVSCLLLTTLGGAAALAGSGRSVFEALFQATCAFANSGLWLGSAPSTTAASTHLVLLPLAIVGGLGLPVLIEISDRAFGGPPISRHSRLVLMLTGAFYLGGLALLLLAQASAAFGGGWNALRNTLASCSVAAINTRSAGLPFQSPLVFTIAGQWVLILLMLIGASSAGTAGGIKTTTLWEIGAGIRAALAGRPVSRTTGIASVWLISFSVILFLGILLLASSEPQISSTRLLFLACSAMGNVGLSHDPVSITGPGLLILSTLMLAGRFGSLAILWWMAETTAGADVVVG